MVATVMQVRVRGIAMAAAVVALAVLALPAGVRAQTSNGNGIQGFLDNLFTGSIAKGGQGASLAARGGSEQLQPAPKQPASSLPLILNSMRQKKIGRPASFTSSS